MPVSGGTPTVLCSAPNPRGGTWSVDGTIIYTPEVRSPLYRVPARGGTCSAFMPASAQVGSPRWPDMLPDGRRFLFYSEGAVHLASTESKESRKVLDSAASALYRDGHLLFVRSGRLMAQRFDPDSIKLMGEPVPIADRVLYRLLFRSMVSVSSTGLLAYETGGAAETPELALVDQNGQSLQVLASRSEMINLAFSHDGTRVAFDVEEPDASSNIWLYDVGRNVRSRLTFHSRFARAPVWSQDGRRVVFTAGEQGSDLYVKNSDGSNPEELLLKTTHSISPNAWSPDGRQIAFSSVEPDTRLDIWILPLDDARRPYPYLRTRFTEHSADFSPDGKWIAFVSDQSGAEDVYVAPFPLSGSATRISTGGAGSPRWSRDGRSIFYFDISQLRLVARSVETGNDKVVVGATRPLFEFRTTGRTGRSFDISPDADRFALIRASGPEEPNQMHLLINWPAIVKR